MNNNNRSSFLLFFIIFLTSFLLGFIISLQIGKISTGEMLKTQINDSIIGVDESLDLKKFWKVYNYIKSESYDNEDVKNTDLIDGAIKGLVEGLGDKHSEYFTKTENERFSDSLSGDFEGIGAVVEVHPLGIKIDRLIKGAPAKKFGLLSGDIILKANGEELVGLDLIDAVGKIKGPAGTKVVLEILRSGEKDVLNKEVIRDKISIPSVSAEEYGDLGYISVNMFGEYTSEEFNKELEKFKDKKGLIIDLRDNGGGYLISAVEILSNFIENGEKLVITKDRSVFGNAVYNSINFGDLYEGKIVVLINENSASASEITAGALSDYKKAILVGKKSYGKGSVQKPFELGDGSMVKLTISKWFTPNDKNIDKEGISPDIEIDFEKQDYDLDECIKVGVCEENMKIQDFKGYDRQLEDAKKVLNKFIELDAYRLTIDKFNENEIEK